MNLPDENTIERHGRAFWRRVQGSPLGFRFTALRRTPGADARRRAAAVLQHLLDHDAELRRHYNLWQLAAHVARQEAIAVTVASVPDARASGVRLVAKGEDGDEANGQTIRAQLAAVRGVRS